MSNNLNKLSIKNAVEGLKKKDFSAVELTQSCLNAIEAAPEINAFVKVTPEHAIAQARLSDERIKQNDVRPLEGVPLGIKDLFCTQGIETTASSKILKGFIPTYESTVTSKLLSAGAITLGKINCDEFAMGSSNENSAFGNCLNPWKSKTDADKKLVPGGSSGGSAAAVAAHQALATTATDTGGSIRQPAAFTGTVGIKPTYGRCSRWGIVAFASSLDQAGPITKTVYDAALMLENMAGFDEKDSTSINESVPKFTDSVEKSIKGKVIGIPEEYKQGLDADVLKSWDKAIEILKDAGAEIKNVSLPHASYALAAYYIIAPAEASSNLARYDGVRYGLRVNADKIESMMAKTRTEGFGHEVQRRIMIGTYVLSSGYYDAYYTKAQKIRTLIKRDFDNLYHDGVDAVLTPTTPTAAFGIGEKASANPVEMYLNDIFTVTVNMAGLPGMSIPSILNNDGLPLGVQLIGKAYEEEELFSLGAALEKGFGSLL